MKAAQQALAQSEAKRGELAQAAVLAQSRVRQLELELDLAARAAATGSLAGSNRRYPEVQAKVSLAHMQRNRAIADLEAVDRTITDQKTEVEAAGLRVKEHSTAALAVRKLSDVRKRELDTHAAALVKVSVAVADPAPAARKPPVPRTQPR